MENYSLIQTRPEKLNKSCGRAGISLAFPIAFLYARIFIFGLTSYGKVPDGVAKLLFTLLFIIWNETVLEGRCKRRKFSSSDIFWYTSLLLSAALLHFAPELELAMLILHIVVFYATAVRSRGLLKGRTSEYIIGDFFVTMIIRPFANFVRVFQDIGLFAGEKKFKGKAVVGILAIVFIFPAFLIALNLLGQIDPSFGNIISNITDYISSEEIGKDIVSLILAFPVGMYLYGMLSGCARKDEEDMLIDGNRTDAFFDKLRAAPVAISRILLILFDLLYVIFFCFRGNYYFDSFSGKIGEGFTLAEYARQGFFELCGIMAVNLFVFCVIRFLTLKEEFRSVINKILLTLLMCESLVFAISSLSKLLLYFSIYGYTAKRILAMWGTVFLGAGCILVIISLFIEKKDYMRIWTVITMSTYIMMCIASGIFNLTGSVYNRCEVQLDLNEDISAVTWTFYGNDSEVIGEHTEKRSGSNFIGKDEFLTCEKPEGYDFYTITITKLNGNDWKVDYFHEKYQDTIIRITENDNGIYHSSIR